MVVGPHPIDKEESKLIHVNNTEIPVEGTSENDALKGLRGHDMAMLIPDMDARCESVKHSTTEQTERVNRGEPNHNPMVGREDNIITGTVHNNILHTGVGEASSVEDVVVMDSRTNGATVGDTQLPSEPEITHEEMGQVGRSEGVAQREPNHDGAVRLDGRNTHEHERTHSSTNTHEVPRVGSPLHKRNTGGPGSNSKPTIAQEKEKKEIAPNTHRNHGCPHSSEFGDILKDLEVDTSDYKTYLPKLGEIDQSEIQKLAEEVLLEKRWNLVKPWLTDEKQYEGTKLMKNELDRCIAKLKKSQFAEWRDTEYAEVCTREQLKGGMRLFAVPEHAKRRWRLILHTISVNSSFPVSSSFTLPSLEEIKLSVNKGDYAAQFDMKNWFTQFGLAPGVRDYYVTKAGNKYYRATRLPTGMRQSCTVAQCASEILAEKTKKYVSTYVYIDNILFVGTRENVKIAIQVFLEECARVKATVNDVDFDNYDPEKYIQQELVFSGMTLNYADKTIALGPKTRMKVEKVWEAADRLSHRMVSAYLALLFFASRVSGVHIANHHDAMDIWRKLHSEMGKEDNQKWDVLANLSETERKVIEEWRLEIVNMKPAKVEDTMQDFEFALITDASAGGWGGILINAHTGEVTVVAGLPEAGANSKDSNVSEPWGLFRAIMHCTSPNQRTRIKIFTDNTPLVAAVNRKFAAASASNKVMQLLLKMRPKLSLHAEHVPGKINPADPLSRQAKLDAPMLKKFVDAHMPNGFGRVILGRPADIPYRCGKQTVKSIFVPRSTTLVC